MTTLAWRGLDDPDRLDTATVVLGPDSMRAIGTSRTAIYASQWSLRVGPGWITASIAVDVRGFDWSRRLVLQRSSDGEWSADADAHGEVELPEPGIVDGEGLSGVLDCDLGLCPVTNTMPIRRLGLLDADVEPIRIATAWIDVPSLRVVRSDQLYASRTTDGTRAIEFGLADGSFEVSLDVDAHGLVRHYPELATELSLDQPG